MLVIDASRSRYFYDLICFVLAEWAAEKFIANLKPPFHHPTPIKMKKRFVKLPMFFQKIKQYAEM
jgi:hypothetical protein